MVKIEKNSFKVAPNITKEQLIKYGFHYHYPDKYIYRVPCYKYRNRQPLIFLEFTIIFDNNNKDKIENPVMLVNCKDKNDNFYAPFYGEYFNKNEVLNKVNRKLSLVIADMINKQIVITKNTKSKRRRK